MATALSYSCGKVRCRFLGEIRAGDEVEVLIRPENISVSLSSPDVVENVWQAAVDQVTFLGECQDCNVKIQDESLRIRVHPALELKPGQKVYLETNPHRCSAILSQ